MTEDHEGFLYPQVDSEACIDCGLCEKVCPAINQGNPILPLTTYAARNNDENIRYKSSSGGIFTLLAEQIIGEGGVVFGAKFDEQWNVVHSYSESIEGLEQFRGSKYVQSSIGDNYKCAKQFLLEGRKVLFSGTPCQIAGLKNFLQKEYENLLTVEVVCHGVPSPRVWRDYLKYRATKYVPGEKSDSLLLKESPMIIDISFRDKSNGWEKYGFKISYAVSEEARNTDSKSVFTAEEEVAPFTEDLFMKGFLGNLYLRPSCYLCVFKQGKSGADISIADYWGIQSVHPELNDDGGVNLVLINTTVGEGYFSLVRGRLTYTVSDYQEAIVNNPSIVKSEKEPSQRTLFWKKYEGQGVVCIDGICQSMAPSKLRILVGKVVRKLKFEVK